MGCAIKSSKSTHDWLETFEKEEQTFGSSSVFMDMKLMELKQYCPDNADGRPNPVKAAVCADLLTRICATKCSMPEVSSVVCFILLVVPYITL
jgi:hypothetical protein